MEKKEGNVQRKKEKRRPQRELIDFGKSSKTHPPNFSDSQRWLAVSTVEPVRQPAGIKYSESTGLTPPHLPPKLLLENNPSDKLSSSDAVLYPWRSTARIKAAQSGQKVIAVRPSSSFTQPEKKFLSQGKSLRFMQQVKLFTLYWTEKRNHNIRVYMLKILTIAQFQLSRTASAVLKSRTESTQDEPQIPEHRQDHSNKPAERNQTYWRHKRSSKWHVWGVCDTRTKPETLQSRYRTAGQLWKVAICQIDNSNQIRWPEPEKLKHALLYFSRIPVNEYHVINS